MQKKKKNGGQAGQILEQNRNETWQLQLEFFFISLKMP